MIKTSDSSEEETAFIHVPDNIANLLQKEAANEAKEKTTAALLNPDTPDQITVSYNANLTIAIEQAQSDLFEMVCARAARYVEVAQTEQRKSGVGVEYWLLTQLNHNTENAIILTNKHTTLDGSPYQQDQARPMVIDKLAILTALQDLQQGETPYCRLNLADSVRAVNQFQFVAKQKLDAQMTINTGGQENGRSNSES